MEENVKANLKDQSAATETEINSVGSANGSSDYSIDSATVKQLLDLITSKDQDSLKTAFSKLHNADIAEFISLISSDERLELIKLMQDWFDPEILVNLDNLVREEIIDILGTKQSASFIKTLGSDDAVEIMENLEEEDRKTILEAMPDKDREILEEGLAFPEDSAGRLIEKKIVSVPEFWTVGQTIDYLRSSVNLPSDFYQIFIVDPKQVPIGGVLVSKILRSTRDTLMKDLMYKNLKVIHQDEDQEEVARIFQKYGLIAAPVVNDAGRIIGVIDLDDILDVIEEEAQEDIMHLGGVRKTDIHANSIFTLFSRFPWLFLNLGTAFIAASVIGFFDASIAKITTLAILMPVAASMGGNAGTQCFTVIVRAIATKELSHNNLLRVFSKEILVGLLNGIVFASITALASYLWFHDPKLSLIFGSAIMLTLFVAAMAGVIIPLILNKSGVDPAVSSGIILTAVTDVTAFASFLGLATIFLM